AAADLRIFGPHLASLAGFAVAAGDLNGDGIADVIIGSPGANKAGSARAYGAAYVFFGGAELVGLRDLAAAPSSAMGPDVAVFGAEASSPISGDQLGAGLAVGDLNGDRVSDLIVSAPLADGPDNQRREAGEIYVFFGGSDLTKGTTVDLAQTNAPLTVHGATSSDQLGLAIALGDVNGDGTNDLIMGSRGRVITAGENVGATYVIFGNQMLAGQPIRDLNQTAPPIATGADIFISGPARRGFLGFSVASGDINGDQIGDLIIGANHANNPSDIETGVVYIFNGRPGLASGTMLDAAAPSPPQGANVVVLGVEQGDELGFSVAAGDVNADGIADLLMSAPGGDGPNNSRSGAGETYVVFGER
ncbi:MAG: FG-GAP repeat protein, partial [Acidobacteria bacterium]|nr:FG-GAP repeat protein [Acidobacteriota bacterium]